MSAATEAGAETVLSVYHPIRSTNAIHTLKSRFLPNRAGGFPRLVHVRVHGFFAAVEQARRPKLCGKPVLVGDGVVISASYEARFFGVWCGMPIVQALALCPNAVVLPGRYDRYAECAERVRAIIETFTPAIEPDAHHGFYLDFAGAEHVWQDFPGTLRRMQLEILKRSGLSVSLGAGKTRVIAALASRIEEPRGLRIVECGTEDALLGSLRVEALDGIGDIDANELCKRGISTMAELRRVPLASLEFAYGRVLGRQIWESSRGVDVRDALWTTGLPSLSNPSLARRIYIEGGTVDAHYLGSLAGYLCKRVSSALFDASFQTHTVGLRIRYVDHFSASQTWKFSCSSNQDGELAAVVHGLLRKLFTRRVAVQSLKVTAGGLIPIGAPELPVSSRSAGVRSDRLRQAAC
jgi:DNA polymerase IV